MIAGWLDLDGRRLETGWWGPGPDAAPSIVLLHEGLGCLGLWRDFPAQLAEATGCGVFAYSRFGYGRSDPATLPRPFSYLHDEACLVLPRLLAAAGIGRHMLLGHSDGASIALIAAGGCPPPGLRGTVAIAPHVFVEEVTLAGLAEARRRWEAGPLQERLARWHRNPVVAFHGWNDTWLDPGFQGWNLRRELAGIRAPLLVLQGEADAYGSPEQLARIRQDCPAPLETRLLPGIGHAPHQESEAEVLGLLAGFAVRVFMD